MKKTLLIVCLMLFSVVLVYGTAGAVTGACASCHTMHNSQDGVGVAMDSEGNTQAEPLARLLKAGCVSCHMADADEQRASGSYGPKVLSGNSAPSMGPGGTNAGGDFYWVNAGSDSRGHNVIDLPGNSLEDVALGQIPPGFDMAMDVMQETWGGSNQLSCAGAYGCHGSHASTDDKWAAVAGAHHNNTDGALNTATTTGNSFRFLDGIKGYEDSNWEWYATSSLGHNLYKGASLTANRAYDDTTPTYGATDTISYLCAECHGLFHSNAAEDAAYDQGSDPWRRHPTDIILPAAGEYTFYTTYSIVAPVGKQDITEGMSGSVVPGSDIVICLSCHRAHGSDQPDLLRWDYDTMVAGSDMSNTGCFTCHTTKD